MSKNYGHLIVQNGFKDTNVFVSCTLGTSVDMNLLMKLKLKSVSNVWQSLQAERDHFTDETWEKIERSMVGESINFFSTCSTSWQGVAISTIIKKPTPKSNKIRKHRQRPELSSTQMK